MSVHPDIEADRDRLDEHSCCTTSFTPSASCRRARHTSGEAAMSLKRATSCTLATSRGGRFLYASTSDGMTTTTQESSGADPSSRVDS